MKFRFAALAILIASCAPPPEPAYSGPPPELAGRTTGSPRSCVPIDRYEPLRVAENNRHLLIYGYGRTMWVNNLGPDCGFDQQDLLVTHPFGSSYCQGDIIHSVDRSSRIPGPACVLGAFTPYTR